MIKLTAAAFAEIRERAQWSADENAALLDIAHARIAVLEADAQAMRDALQEIAQGLLPVDKSAKQQYLLCASRLCGIARAALAKAKL